MVFMRASASPRHDLRAVKFSGSETTLRRFPHFLVVGPQRTGTTWLHRQLERHPHVFLPPEKELYYFNTLTEPEHPKHRSRELRWYLRRFRDSPWSYWRKRRAAMATFGTPYRPRVRGECTASYAVLEPDIIREIVTLRPEIRIIFMVRDPVERAWSHAVKDLVKRRGRPPIESLEPDEVFRFLDDPYQLSCGNFTGALANWRAQVRPGHLFVGQFEELSGEPEQFLEKVFEFLGLDRYPQLLEGLRRRVNPSGASSVPQPYRAHLEAVFAEERARLKEARFAHQSVVM